MLTNCFVRVSSAGSPTQVKFSGQGVAEGMTSAGKDPIFQPEEYSARDKREPRQFPEGVFGQKYPQNITTKEGYPSVDALKVKPEPQHKDADKIGLDGLPHVGAVVWPSESYYSTVDRMTCELPTVPAPVLC